MAAALAIGGGSQGMTLRNAGTTPILSNSLRVQMPTFSSQAADFGPMLRRGFMLLAAGYGRSIALAPPGELQSQELSIFSPSVGFQAM